MQTLTVGPKLLLIPFPICCSTLLFITALVLCCVEMCLWLLVAHATAPLGFVLFVAKIQYCCLLLQGCGPKFWVLNDALEPHTVKSTAGQQHLLGEEQKT